MLPQTLPQFLWFYCKRYKLSLLGLISASLFWAISISLNPYCLKLLIDQMAAIEIEKTDLFHELWIPSTLYVLLTLLTTIVLRFYDWILLSIFPKIKSEITVEVFDYLERHSYRYFQENLGGSLTGKINDLSRGAIQIIYHIIDQFISRLFSLTIGSITMYLVHPLFAGLLIGWNILFIGISIFLTKKSQNYAENYSKSRSTVIGRIGDSIANIFAIKLYAREDHEKQELLHSLNASVANDRHLQWFLIKTKIFYGFSITFLTAGMISLLIYERSQNHITIGDFALILTLVTVLVRDVFLITSQLVNFSEELGACKQALSTLLTQRELTDSNPDLPLRVTEGKIVFNHVHFEYKKGSPLFFNKSVTIYPGSKVGIVGVSGSGKTTFINLILRFFDVCSGSIEIDGQDLKKVTQKSIRDQISLIPQDPLLFHRSLMENIRYGRLEASDKEVIESSKKAHCHEFIEALEKGYDSLVGERGVKLSGGQKQRILIARAILKNAPILILDEATSSLDSTTEGYIQDSLSQLMGGKTTLVIAHRLSTLFRMDRILVFHEGKIVEDGTHRDLIELKGRYSTLWKTQMNLFLKTEKAHLTT